MFKLLSRIALIYFTFGFTQAFSEPVSYASKPVECMETKVFIKMAKDNGFQILIGGLGIADTIQNGEIKESQVMVVWWLNQEDLRWAITEIDPKGELCVIGRGSNANFESEKINEIIDTIIAK